MLSLRAVVLSFLIYSTWCEELSFPPDFMFGAASAAYQVEGGWKAADKGESLWDALTHETPSKVFDGNTGDIACDSYNQWRRDIEMAAELGLSHYRFSLSWTRILPTGFANYISEDGKNYYNNLIDGLLARNIEPLVTIHHFDLPSIFQDMGGFTNPLIVDWFADFARVVYSLFADRVKYWISINEPLGLCDAGYNGVIAPALHSPDLAVYLCSKYVLLAHAKAWRIYDEEYKPKYHGKMTISQLALWFEPLREEDEERTALMNAFCEERFGHPIFKGNWPPDLAMLIEERSFEKGFSRSRLPSFTQQEAEYIKGTYDYYALNHYTTFLVKIAEGNESGIWPFTGAPEIGVVFRQGEGWETAAPSWFGIYPEGLRNQLNWIREKYGDVQILITENGYADDSNGLRDVERVQYIKNYLGEVLKAIKIDKINVTAYTAWTLMDNFEWLMGYKIKYGIYEVDFNSPNRTRTPRDSANYYASVIKNRSL
ncbi:myrosinase 1-like [Bombyx mandarina]|uniref:Myrosinase 1-like n=1 Tax=Bombyx mandarina TaxID=7092 RepID=A0A6J2K717_BOMMA|nr:myrosinase 1-like [Bombyx mandarina]